MLSALVLCPSGAASDPSIVVEGNRRTDAQAIREHFHASPAALQTPAAIDAALKELYQTGLFQDGGGRVDLVFEIKEGAKTGVKRIAFVGNREFAESRLKGVIKTTESGWLGFLKTSDVYDPDRMESDTDLLHRFYLRNGFADAHVSSDAVYDPTQQGFVLTFTIDEGARYRFGTIDISSRVTALDASVLRNVLRLAQGDAFDGEAVGKAADDITMAAGRSGFPFVDVHPHANRDVAAKTINVVFTIDDGS